MGRVGGWHFAGPVHSWGRVVLESKTRSQLADCSIDNGSFDELVLRGCSVSRSWEFSLTYFPSFSNDPVSPIHPVLNPLLLISLPAAEPAWDHRLSWRGDNRGCAGLVVGDRAGRVSQDRLWGALLIKSKGWDLTQLVMVNHQKFSYETAICGLKEILRAKEYWMEKVGNFYKSKVN